MNVLLDQTRSVQGLFKHIKVPLRVVSAYANYEFRDTDHYRLGLQLLLIAHKLLRQQTEFFLSSCSPLNFVKETFHHFYAT